MDSIINFLVTMVAYNPMPVINNACDYIMRDLIICANEDKHDSTIREKKFEFDERVKDCKLIKFKTEDGKNMCFYEHPDGTKSIFYEDNKNCPHTKKCLGK